MKRRLAAAFLAIVLAGVGGLLVLTYVKAADRRAMAGMETVDVFVVTELIAQGTPGEALANRVATKTLPAKAVVSGSVSSLDSVTGRVSTTDLQPGEQLLASRFVDPKSLEESDEVEIPEGLQQVSVSLEPQRVLGGNLTPGATVGVFVSLPEKGKLPAQTHLLLHTVLVSKVQGGITTAPPEGAEDAEGAEGAPAAASQSESVLATLVVNASDAEKIVFAAEHGTIWLSLESVDADQSGTRVVTRKNVNE